MRISNRTTGGSAHANDYMTVQANNDKRGMSGSNVEIQKKHTETKQAAPTIAAATMQTNI